MASNGATWSINISNQPTDPELLNSYNRRTTNEVVTVGTGGDYASINAAISDLSTRFTTYISGSIQVEINLLSGFIVNEQITVSGIDLGWIKITSVDATVNFDPSAYAEQNYGTNYCFLVVKSGGTGPKIDISLSQTAVKTGGGLFVCTGAGSALMLETGNTFAQNTFPLSICVLAEKAAQISMEGVTLTSSGLSGNSTWGSILANTGAYIDADLANVERIACNNASTVSAKGATVDNRSTNTNNIFVGNSSRVDFSAGILANTGTNTKTVVAFYCWKSSIADMDNVTVNNIASFTKGILAEYGSTINANSMNFTGLSGTAAEVGFGSTINASGLTGTLSQTANTTTASGIIFK